MHHRQIQSFTGQERKFRVQKMQADVSYAGSIACIREDHDPDASIQIVSCKGVVAAGSAVLNHKAGLFGSADKEARPQRQDVPPKADLPSITEAVDAGGTEHLQH